MHMTSRMSSTILICFYFQSLTTILLSAVLARWVRRWTTDHRAMGCSRKYPHTSHRRHWKSCNKCLVSLTGTQEKLMKTICWKNDGFLMVFS